MASELIERLGPDGDLGGHRFTGFLHIWFHNSGGLGSTAASRAVDNLVLEPAQVTTANAIKAIYDGLATEAEKNEYTERVQAGLSLMESGDITTDEYETLLGI